MPDCTEDKGANKEADEETDLDVKGMLGIKKTLEKSQASKVEILRKLKLVKKYNDKVIRN